MKEVIKPVYILEYLDDHTIYAIELAFRNIMKVSDELFLVKIKRKQTTPALLQFKNHYLTIRNKKGWGLCKQKKEIWDKSKERVVIILEFYNGENVWETINNLQTTQLI